jgi:hypothetical protein
VLGIAQIRQLNRSTQEIQMKQSNIETLYNLSDTSVNNDAEVFGAQRLQLPKHARRRQYQRSHNVSVNVNATGQPRIEEANETLQSERANEVFLSLPIGTTIPVNALSLQASHATQQPSESAMRTLLSKSSLEPPNDEARSPVC